MKKQEAERLVEQTLNGKFAEASFQRFIVNLLKNFTRIGTIREEQHISHAFAPTVNKFKIVAKFHLL